MTPISHNLFGTSTHSPTTWCCLPKSSSMLSATILRSPAFKTIASIPASYHTMKKSHTMPQKLARDQENNGLIDLRLNSETKNTTYLRSHQTINKQLKWPHSTSTRDLLRMNFRNLDINILKLMRLILLS